ncbi:MAG: Rrf2 family transcriptional regulator [Isosphaeraceae bacterium]
MRVSAKAEYACLAVIALAILGKGDRPVRIREIADTQGIPETFLTQILLKLKAAGLVHSTRGASGGYRLARSAEHISLGEVIHVVDGLPVPSREPTGPAGPVLAQIWDQIRDSQTQVLSRTSIAHLARQASPLDWVI